MRRGCLPSEDARPVRVAGWVLLTGCFFLMPVEQLVQAGTEQEKGARVPDSGRTPRTERSIDPLPPGATARLGTVRWRFGREAHPVGFSPDSKTLFTINFGDTLSACSWDLVTGRLLHTFGIPHEPFGESQPTALSADGKTLAFLDSSRHICLREVATGKRLRKFRGKHSVGKIVFSPDGTTLATFHVTPEATTGIHLPDPTICLWDVATGKETRHLKGAELEVGHLTFSPDGKLIASGDILDDTLRLFAVASGKEVHRIKTPDCTITAVAFSPDSKVLALCCDKSQALNEQAQGKVRLWFWEAATGKELHHLDVAHEGVAALAFSPDGKALACASSGVGAIEETKVRLWDMATGRELQQPQGIARVSSLRFSPDGKVLAGGSESGLCLWEVATGRRLDPPPEGPGRPVQSVAFSPDGQTVISTGHAAWSVCLWKPTTGQWSRPLYDRDGGGLPVAVAPDGKTLVSLGEGNSIRLQDLATGKLLRQLGTASKDSWYPGLVFSPDGKVIAVTGTNVPVRLWEGLVAVAS
jgi:WD40 repeat protein